MSTEPIDQQVMNKIKDQHLVMRPRRSFVLHRWYIGALFVLFGLVIVFVTSFTLYTLHRTGVLYLLTLGSGVFKYLLHPFSWFTGLLVLGCLALVVVFGKVIAAKTSVYRIPLVYVWAVAGVSMLLGGAIVFVTPLHNSLKAFADDQKLSVVESIYNAATRGTETNTATGVVREVSANGFELVTLSKTLVTVRLNGSTAVQKGYTIHNNDAVIVVGEMSKSVLTAEFVHQSPAGLSADETRELSNVDVTEDTTE